MPAVSSWPFPTVPMPGLNITEDEALVRSPFESDTKTRRRSSVSGGSALVVLIMFGSDLEALRTWRKTTLAGGALTFTYKDPVTETDAEYQFAGPISATPRRGGTASDRLWTVSFPLRRIPS